MEIWPASGRVSPSIISSVVVFPAPLGPRSPKTSPAATVRSTPATARMFGNCLRRPRTTIWSGMWGDRVTGVWAEPCQRFGVRATPRIEVEHNRPTPMAFDERLADRVRAVLRDTDVTERRMFGGLAFLLRGHMCVGIIGHDLMVPVGADQLERAVAEKHARPMDFTRRPAD